MVVSAIHDTCTIVPVKGETIAVQEDTYHTVIPGIEEAMSKAFEEERLLRDSDLVPRAGEPTPDPSQEGN